MVIPKIKLNGINALNLVGAAVVVYLLVVLVQTVKHNYDLGRQAEDIKVQMSILQNQKEQLTYNIQYFGTDSFRDREARSKLGLQLPGENVIIIPRTKVVPTPAPRPRAVTDPQRSNLGQWFDFLGGKS
jgi:hypothetical protein